MTAASASRGLETLRDADIDCVISDYDMPETDGPGIPPDERESVFERGYTSNGAGTGFGPYVVDEIADAHGWDIRVTEGEDGGRRFEIVGVE